MISLEQLFCPKKIGIKDVLEIVSYCRKYKRKASTYICGNETCYTTGPKLAHVV